MANRCGRQHRVASVRVAGCLVVCRPPFMPRRIGIGHRAADGQEALAATCLAMSAFHAALGHGQVSLNFGSVKTESLPGQGWPRISLPASQGQPEPTESLFGRLTGSQARDQEDQTKPARSGARADRPARSTGPTGRSAVVRTDRPRSGQTSQVRSDQPGQVRPP